MVRAILLVLLVLTAALTLVAAHLAGTRFIPYQTAVDSILRVSKETDPLPPDSIRRGFSTLQTRTALAYNVATALYPDVGIHIEREIWEWNVHGLVWELLLPRRLTQDDMVVLYLHYVHYGNDGTLAEASQKYFGVGPSALTRKQALGLMAVARSPTRYSPILHPQAHDSLVRALEVRYTQARH